MATNWGYNPDLNKALASATGYTGDFGSGGFSNFMQANPQFQNTVSTLGQLFQNKPTDYGYGPNQFENQRLAQMTGYKGNFGSGGFNEFLAQNPTARTAQVNDMITNRVVSPTTNTPVSSNPLTLADLDQWWSTKQQQNNNTSNNINSLSTLYPRVNWGNYQTANRGARYFDTNTGNYSGFNNTQQASL